MILAVTLLLAIPVHQWYQSSMAEKIIRVIESDLDGSPADQTINFSVDGKKYALDVTKAQAEEFRRLLDPYVKAARKGKTSRVDSDAAAIRAWAHSNGIQVNERGRISKDVRDKYREANK